MELALSARNVRVDLIQLFSLLNTSSHVEREQNNLLSSTENAAVALVEYKLSPCDLAFLEVS